MIAVKEIKQADTIEIRHQVLRQGLPVESCYWDTDNLDATFHLGGYLGDAHVGIATFQQEACPIAEYSDDPFTYRLRGMAVLPEARKEHVGSLLLAVGEDRLRRLGCSLLWCHARIGAVAFYEKCGWTKVGELFEIPTAGMHYLMYKDISEHPCAGCKGNA